MRKFLLHIRKRKRAKVFREKNQSDVRSLRNPQFRHEQPRHSRTQSENSELMQWLRKDGWALGGIIAILLFSAWYFGFHSEKYIIREVSIQGTEFIDEALIKGEVDQFVLSKSFGLVRRNTFWTLKPSKLKTKLETIFREQYALDYIEVAKTFPDTVTVTVHEQIPSVAWVTTTGDRHRYYLVSREGVVTQALGSIDDVHLSFPIIQDKNRDAFEPGWHVASENYVGFILYLHDHFTEVTGLEIDSYVFPRTECQEKQYVAEKVFQQEILDSASEEFQEKKREIQQLFLDGLLTIDQSLVELERIKREELEGLGGLTEGEEALQKLEFEVVYVPTQCDYVKVATNVSVVVKNGDEGTYEVTMDMSVDPVIQMENVLTVLKEKIGDRSSLRYIDVRLPDRAYYK